MRTLNRQGKPITFREEVVLFSGEKTGYEIPITLSENIFNFESIYIYCFSQKHDLWSVNIPVLESVEFLNCNTVTNFKNIVCYISGQNKNNNDIKVNGAIWSSSTQNTAITFHKIIGIRKR